MKKWIGYLFIIILVVFMLLCGYMLGRMDFNSSENTDGQYVNEDGNIITNNENLSDDKEQSSDLNNIADNKINSSDDFMKLFVGKYNYEKVYEDLSSDCNKSYVNLEIKMDGTYTYSYGNACGGGGIAKGNYSIAKDKIYLFNDNCKFVSIDNECVEPNCSTLIKLDYTLVNENIKIVSGDLASVPFVELEKIS